MTTPRTIVAALALVAIFSGCRSTAPVLQAPPAVETPVPESPVAGLDTVRAGRLDNGKMWTFEYPPLDYLAETYGFRPDAAWFERARLGALRLPGCSAAFVSPNGLVATNHHCVRSAVVEVTQEGERLLETGFTARSLAEERPVAGLYVDQLVAIADVTAEVERALEGVQGDAARAAARQAAIEAIEQRLTAERSGTDGEYVVEVVSLYHGGRYSAYTFRRYTDLRLVAAPEEQLGYFGGDSDNFTYPRYSLDFAFLRVYDADGQPFRSDVYFQWSEDGVQEGDLVFILGNPGSTNRLETVAQLLWRRDVQVPGMLAFLNSRMEAIAAHMAEAPDDASARNLYFSLSNAQKAYTGRLNALNDPYLIARRRDAERQFRSAIEADPALRATYGDLFDQVAAVQDDKRAWTDAYLHLQTLFSASTSSSLLTRAVLAVRLQQAGDNPELEARLLAVGDRPEGLEVRLLAAQVDALQQYFTAAGQPMPAVLQGGTALEVAERLRTGSVLREAASTEQALDAGGIPSNDPALQLVAAVMPRYDAFARAFTALSTREAELNSRLGRARFDVYGTAVPPDATFSPRFTDGVVKGYAYNGTVAPPHTTFHGLYDHYYSYGAGTAWDLPERWLAAPAAFDRSTPLNFVSTADTIGGNSGSPAVDRDLRLVGLNFDRTIEGLSRDYIYLPDRGRNVMVDARAVLESLDDVYDLDRIVLELTSGRLYATEAEADGVQ